MCTDMHENRNGKYIIPRDSEKPHMSIRTRSDIASAVNNASQFFEKPMKIHWSKENSKIFQGNSETRAVLFGYSKVII